MGDQLDSDGCRRRTFLVGSGIAAVGFAGCLDDESQQTSGNGNGSDDGNDDGADEEEEDDEEEDDELAPPDPDFVVGSSAEADYETLQDAYDSLESGDVIGLEPGKHTVQPEVESDDVEGESLTKTYTYVGGSSEETVIEILTPEARSFTVRGILHFLPEDGAPGFWNATLEVPEDVEYTRLEDVDAYDDEQIDANYCTIHGTIGGPTTAHETEFNDDLSHELSATDCRFYGEVTGPSITARRSQFYDDVKSRSGWILDSSIEGTVNLNGLLLRRCDVNQGINVTGSGTVEDCVVDSKPDSSLAIDIRSEYSAVVTGSEINGSVRSNQDGSYIDRFELNRFEADTSYIIDGAPATDIYLNAFVGGDVRITTDSGDLASFPAEELTMYDPERELGNYYSEWDAVDEADDGILGTRTLPGEDGTMDRYPLANSDVEAYAKAAEEDEEDDD
ncbi:hypothetical protein [Natrarchaeobius chitinivorans]|uniref:Right-handed parallel beta-helix repeat-containing protein n=1 Tax=Natrarchaeobius chitinivorans TaxID=1679083 RepID=A0A3N6PHU2_NATCH|nr:hypothetical protein [Natrarchaeobius chitinivorans]RQG97725.1 hypothetical protein EA473_00450 [Natrarchaeobius chitinivorans]